MGPFSEHSVYGVQMVNDGKWESDVNRHRPRRLCINYQSTFGFSCLHFPLLHLLTFLHHRQHLQISLLSGLQLNQKFLGFSPTVPTSNPTPILYPPGSSKNVHQFSFPQSRISSTSLSFLVSSILFSSNQPYLPFSRNPPWTKTSYPIIARYLTSLSLISKIIERVVKSRLTDYLSSNNLAKPSSVRLL